MTDLAQLNVNGDDWELGIFTDTIVHPEFRHMDPRLTGIRYLETRENLAIAVLGNVQSVARDEIRRLVAGAVFGEELEVLEPRRFAAAGGLLDELVGRYSFGPGFVVSVSQSDGRLLARANEGGSSELIPLGGSAWFSRMLYATVRFERNAEGTVDRLVWGTGANAPAGERLP